MRHTKTKAEKSTEQEAAIQPTAEEITAEPARADAADALKHRAVPHLKATRSVFYFVSSASRPSITAFYDQLVTKGVIPHGFPHDQAVHSGIFIYNHLTGRVEDLIEGSGNRDGHLVLYRNRASTIAKLENTSTLPGSDKSVRVYGFWKQAYKIKTHLATRHAKRAVQIFNRFYDDFNSQSAVKPLPYIPGKIDCQTCTHHLLHLITGKAHVSPHGEYTLGWGNGSKSPHDVFDEITTTATKASHLPPTTAALEQ